MYTESLARLAPEWLGQGPTPFRKFKLVDGQLVDGQLVDGQLVDTPPYQVSALHRFHLSELARTVRGRMGGSRARNRYALNEALLNRFFDLTRQLNATPVVVFFPGTHDTPQGRERRGFLRTWADAKGVAFGDLTDVIHGAGVEKTYIGDNTHWNEYGHELAGRALHELLASRALHGSGADIDPRTLPAPPWRQRVDFCSDRGASAQESSKAGSLQ